MTDELTPHQKIIKRWDSLSTVARAVNTARPSEKPVTKAHVQYWYESGMIPSKYHSAFLFAGQALVPMVEHSDFFEDGAARAPV